MPAAITDKLDYASNGTAPVPTTLASQKNVAAASLSMSAATGWPTTTATHFILYKVDTAGALVAGTVTLWKGTLSGTTMSNLTLKSGTDIIYPAGSVVQPMLTSAMWDDLMDALLTSFDQDGTLKTGAVDVAAVLAANVVTTAKILDANVTEAKLTHRPSEYLSDHVASGLVWSGDAYGSTRLASMTSGVVYIAGVRFAVGAVNNRTFTASKDTYIDVDSTGALVYTEVANNAASPALASGTRIGIIVTGAGNIANVGSVNQGQPDKLLPIASSAPYSVTDSLGNRICGRDPSGRLRGYKQITTSATTTATAAASVAALCQPTIIPLGRQFRVTIYSPQLSHSAAVQPNLTLYSGASAGALTTALQLAAPNDGTKGSAQTLVYIGTGTGSTLFMNAAIHGSSAGTTTFFAAATSPGFMSVELI